MIAVPRNPRLLSWASGYSLLIVLLDALTLWALLHAVGHAAPFAGIFASFMLASVLRSVGIVPGGLGAFEAAAVATLSWAGVPLAAGLSATLLFRVLSFWLPMLPGFWLSRDALRAGAADHHETVTPDYWSQPLDELYASLKTGPNGLASDAAAARQPSVRRTYRPNLARQVGASLLRQLSSPLVLILLIGALVALIATGLFLPLIGFETVTDIRNEVILQTRMPLLAALVAAAACCWLLALVPPATAVTAPSAARAAAAAARAAAARGQHAHARRRAHLQALHQPDHDTGGAADEERHLLPRRVHRAAG